MSADGDKVLTEDDIAGVVKRQLAAIGFDPAKTHVQFPPSTGAGSPSPQPGYTPTAPDFEHNVRWYEKNCKNGGCGAVNANYKRPTHFCKNCRVPVDITKPTCENGSCGGTQAVPYPEEVEE